MKYRPEIDGLRALAVAPVILFHAGFSVFQGGFVGVDVFFVISGYLITSIIHEEIASGSFTFTRFYERRVRRLLPALFFVMAVSIPFAWLWLLPSDMELFAKSVAATSVFSSNILFWRESGYFDAAASLKPLLHTWSLAVEEQYYLIFPLILLLAERTRKALLPILAILLVASLWLAQASVQHHQAFAYFLLPTRLWELLIGSFVALNAAPLRAAVSAAPRLASLLSGLGLAMIGVSIFCFSEQTPYPSLYTLAPTLGAAIFIATATENSLFGRVLSLKPVVAIGLISYSAYLWHQPIFAFARHRADVQLETWESVLLIALTLALAWFTWRYVERPFRTKRGSRTKIFVFAGVGIVCFTAFGLVGYATNGFAYRLPQNLEWQSLGDRVASVGEVCTFAAAPAEYPNVGACYFGDANAVRTVALYGDSHADTISYELDAQLRAAHIRGVRVSAAGCRGWPIPLISPSRSISDAAACRASYEAASRYIADHADAAIIAIRWTFRLYPVEGEIDELVFDTGEGGREIEDYRENFVLGPDGVTFSNNGDAKRQAVRMLVETMAARGEPVLLVYPVPELGWNIANLNFRAHGDLETLSTSSALYRSRNRFAISALDSVTAPNVIRIHPERRLCDAMLPGRCVGQWNYVPFYLDPSHLSDSGARFVVDDIMTSLNQTSATPR